VDDNDLGTIRGEVPDLIHDVICECDWRNYKMTSARIVGV
jgi:hypothetical protein